MKESISNSYVVMIVMVIISICTLIILSTMSYSKTFKMKNRVIEIIEKYGVYTSKTEDEINLFLRDSGYAENASNRDRVCPPLRAGTNVGQGGVAEKPAINKPGGFYYCIYENETVRGYYYTVIMYMAIDFPLIGDFIKIEFPISGDSAIIFTR